MKILITGHSQGLGSALADTHVTRGDSVTGLSRRTDSPPRDGVTSLRLDLSDAAGLSLPALDRLLGDRTFDLVYLNAGVLGPIRAMQDTSLDALRAVMDVNVWANKLLLDWLGQRPRAPAQVVLMSSGAGVTGHFGWGAYAISKAALNMLAQLYAHEMPDTHICALAPGLVETAMQDQLAAQDAAVYPSLSRLRTARGTEAMPTPAIAAERIASLLTGLRTYPSGSFIDVRTLDA